MMKLPLKIRKSIYNATYYFRKGHFYGVMLHEACHYYTAKYLGIEVEDVIYRYKGGAAILPRTDYLGFHPLTKVVIMALSPLLLSILPFSLIYVLVCLTTSTDSPIYLSLLLTGLASCFFSLFPSIVDIRAALIALFLMGVSFFTGRVNLPRNEKRKKVLEAKTGVVEIFPLGENWISREFVKYNSIKQPQ